MVSPFVFMHGIGGGLSIALVLLPADPATDVVVCLVYPRFVAIPPPEFWPAFGEIPVAKKYMYGRS